MLKIIFKNAVFIFKLTWYENNLVVCFDTINLSEEGVKNVESLSAV